VNEFLPAPPRTRTGREVESFQAYLDGFIALNAGSGRLVERVERTREVERSVKDHWWSRPYTVREEVTEQVPVSRTELREAVELGCGGYSSLSGDPHIRYVHYTLGVYLAGEPDVVDTVCAKVEGYAGSHGFGCTRIDV
jgi:hypothetical protein